MTSPVVALGASPFQDIRLLVVSPLAHLTGQGPDFLGVRFRERHGATSADEVARIFGSARHRFDVVLVDLMWNDFTLEWVFDGLDVVDIMHRSGRHEPVLLAAQGHGFEQPHLEEGRDLPDVYGLVLKGRPDLVLRAVDAAANGERFSDPDLTAALRPGDGAIHTFFERSGRLARLAGAIAAGCAGSYAGIAERLNISTANAARAPELFRPMLQARGELPADEPQLSQASIFRWCGQHAHYILSWCRRHPARVGALADEFASPTDPDW